MQLRILHEPWEFEYPYQVQAANVMTPSASGEPQPLWYHLRRFESEPYARRYMEAYAKGSEVVAEWPATEPAPPVESAVPAAEASA